jgi:hypothetical protein
MNTTREYAAAARSYFRGLGWTPACIDAAAAVVIDAASPAAAELLARGIATKGYRAALAAQLDDHAATCDVC